MKKVFIIFMAVLLSGAFLYTLFYLYKKSKEKPIIYNVSSPFKTNIIKKTVAVGSVVPRKEIDIKPQVSGIIDQLYVKPGQYVKNGDLLAKVRIIPNMVSLNNAESGVKKAEIAYKDKKIEFDRYKELFEKKVIPEAEYKKYKIEFEKAEQELNFSKDNLQLIKEGVTTKMSNATNTLIRTTIEGMVLDVPVEVGNSVIETNNFNEGTTIASVADMGEMIFEGKIDETEVGKLKENMALKLNVGAIEDTSFNAKLEYISPKGKDENGTIQFEIEASVELIDEFFIRAGYSANADIILEQKDSVLAISEAWITFENDSTFVEIETGEQQFEKRPIEIGLSDGVNVEVISGVEIEDKLKSGVKLEINNKQGGKK